MSGKTHAVENSDSGSTLCGRAPDFWAAPSGLVILAESDDVAAVDCLSCGKSLAASGESREAASGGA